MTPPEELFRSGRRGRGRALVAVMIVVTVGVVVAVGLSALRLGGITTDLTSIRTSSDTVASSDREALLLEQMVTALGETTDGRAVAVQAGLLQRQLFVSIAAFPPDAAAARELRAIQQALAAFPWDALPRTGGHVDPRRRSALDLVIGAERRINAVRVEQEKQFYLATTAALEGSRRSQLGLSALVGLVLALGVVGVTVVTRRSRSRIATAYDALKGEVGERRAAEDALRASEGRFRSLVQRASDLTVVTDAAGIVHYVSPAAETLLGYRPEDLLHLPLLVHVEPDQRAAVGQAISFLAEQPGLVHTIELRLCTRDGRVRSVEAVCQNLLADADVAGLVWNGRDVTDRRALEDELTHQARHDPLTGLANRVLLLDRLRGALAAGDAVAVILVDLDGFKNVNDTLGHPAGDELLRSAAQRLLGCVRPEDTTARLGGDEFAVVTHGSAELARTVGRRIVETLRRPFGVAGHEVRIGASVGVASGDGRESAEDLLRDADIAMYAAKNAGKGRVEVFEPAMRVRAAQRTSLQQELARAVESGGIEVHFQPIVDLRTARTTSLEALAQWRGPDGSLVPADVFVPIAEETGAITEIGRVVLPQACRAVQHWRATVSGHGHLGVAVNVSVHQVLSGRLYDDVVDALRDSGLAPSTLTLEIIESTAIEDSERVAAEFARLQAIGVRIAVDDFGAGYSSLGFLIGLHVDTLKIDRTILEFDATRRGSLVAAIAELGRTLGLTVVVEGVETSEHLAWARQASCDAAQGYLFSRPLPAVDVPLFLRASGCDVGQGGVEDGQAAVDLGVGGGQGRGDAEGPAHPR
jgi:diguanylate cyclase (GGDEF)-like protein/PAS domain S-box-containing protein